MFGHFYLSPKRRFFGKIKHMTRNKKLILFYVILGICIFVIVGVFTTNLKYFFLCSDHYIVNCWQASGTQEEPNRIIKTKEIIPCANNRDCFVALKLESFCSPGHANLLKCDGARYYCEDDGYYKGCVCSWYSPARWLSID